MTSGNARLRRSTGLAHVGVGLGVAPDARKWCARYHGRYYGAVGKMREVSARDKSPLSDRVLRVPGWSRAVAVVASMERAERPPQELHRRVLLALGTRRHLRYMAKTELFEGPLGALFLRLGAFPVRRGEADGAAMETARVILRRGGPVAVFPEDTRVEGAGRAREPTTGPGRLAIATGALSAPRLIGQLEPRAVRRKRVRARRMGRLKGLVRLRRRG